MEDDFNRTYKYRNTDPLKLDISNEKNSIKY